MAFKTITVTESLPVLLELNGDDAAVLAALGAELASNRSWWGESIEDKTRSVISIEIAAANRFRVTFRDVIGAVCLSQLHIQVKPKIRPEHFRYLIEHSDLAPRLSARPAELATGDDFVELLARWFMDAAEALLRQGLRQEYSEHRHAIPEVRGKLLPLETTMHLYRGQLLAECEFDELSENTALNRLVKGACERIAGLRSATEQTKIRARRVKYRVSGVGPLRWSDHRARPDRLSQSYARACSLAQLILGGCGITTSSGPCLGTTFLIRTPEVVEDGLRNILSQALPNYSISKRKMMLGDTGLSMAPDLVFGKNRAIGDVKYRLLGSDWHRADLNQIVAFATAFGASECAVFGFIGSRGAARPKPVPVGQVKVKTFGWISSSDTLPQQSAEQLVSDVKSWLN